MLACQGRGNWRAARNEAEPALSDYTRVLDKAPDRNDARLDRGRLYVRLGRWEEATADFTKALELQPDFVPALRNRGHAYHQLGETAKAQADFSAALRFDPTEPERVPVQYRRQGD